MAVGMIGAMLKGFKRRLKASTIFLSMVVAGILTYSILGAVTYFYADLNQKVIVLIAFCTGWVANEITDKLDEFVGDIYDVFMNYLKSKYGNKK
jgi:uncharacterized membrane protein YeaQ/YmgE (transglycosylase-associated protein family)